MEYIGWSVVALLVALFMGLLIADRRRATLEVVIGVVVKKKVPSYPLMLPRGAWEMSFCYETFELEVKPRIELDIWKGVVDVVPVLKSQYDETPIGATIYVKYLETKFLKNKIILEFAILEGSTWNYLLRQRK
ncbi:MAG: hypothetical protein Q8R36_00805 [bacterium]|nr:hypothetical protein [bacterium]